jgi:hypothetical protein
VQVAPRIGFELDCLLAARQPQKDRLQDVFCIHRTAGNPVGGPKNPIGMIAEETLELIGTTGKRF